MEAKTPTKAQNQQFLKACKENDYGMVDYYMYYYEVSFIEGYFLGNRLIKKLIKMDIRRRNFVKMILGNVRLAHSFEYGGEQIVEKFNLDNPYSRNMNTFMALCQCEIFGPKAKLNNYLVTKALIIFLVESGDRKSNGVMHLLPRELIRMTAEFL